MRLAIVAHSSIRRPILSRLRFERSVVCAPPFQRLFGIRFVNDTNFSVVYMYIYMCVCYVLRRIYMYMCMSFHWNIFSSLLFLFFLFKIVLAFRCELFLCGAEFFLEKRTESIRDERFEHIWNRGKNRAKNRENFIIIFFCFLFLSGVLFFLKKTQIRQGWEVIWTYLKWRKFPF